MQKVCVIDPSSDLSWKDLLKSKDRIETDGVHMRDCLNPNGPFTPGNLNIN